MPAETAQRIERNFADHAVKFGQVMGEVRKTADELQIFKAEIEKRLEKFALAEHLEPLKKDPSVGARVSQLMGATGQNSHHIAQIKGEVEDFKKKILTIVRGLEAKVASPQGGALDVNEVVMQGTHRLEVDMKISRLEKENEGLKGDLKSFMVLFHQEIGDLRQKNAELKLRLDLGIAAPTMGQPPATGGGILRPETLPNLVGSGTHSDPIAVPAGSPTPEQRPVSQVSEGSSPFPGPVQKLLLVAPEDAPKEEGGVQEEINSILFYSGCFIPQPPEDQRATRVIAPVSVGSLGAGLPLPTAIPLAQHLSKTMAAPQFDGTTANWQSFYWRWTEFLKKISAGKVLDESAM